MLSKKNQELLDELANLMEERQRTEMVYVLTDNSRIITVLDHKIATNKELLDLLNVFLPQYVKNPSFDTFFRSNYNEKEIYQDNEEVARWQYQGITFKLVAKALIQQKSN